MEEKKLFLLDAMALIYRAYFALQKNPRINSKGFNTSAIVGFANTLLDVLKKERPTHLGVAFDTMAPTARHIEFSDYKAHREKMPEDIGLAIPIIQELLHCLNIPVLYVDGYEADDVIGTLAKEAEKEGFTVYMMTPDKDFGQLVSEHIFMYKPARMGNGVEIMGIKEVCERFDIKRPDQVIDMLGLWGDASDNIPGIPGVGEVTARKLLAQFDNIENLLAHIDQIENEKLREKVEKNQILAINSKMLATILLDVPIDFKKEELLLSSPDFKSLEELLNKLEMRGFAQRIQQYYSSSQIEISVPKEEEKTKKNIIVSSSPDLFSMLDETEAIEKPNILPIPSSHFLKLDDLIKSSMIVKSMENESSAFVLYPECFAFSNSKKEIFCLNPKEWKTEEFSEILHHYFENEKIKKIGFDLKSQIHLLTKQGLSFKGVFEDVQLAHYLISPEGNRQIERLGAIYLRKELPKFEDSHPISACCERASIIFDLWEILQTSHWNPEIDFLYHRVEMPLLFVLFRMEEAGIRIQGEELRNFGNQLKTQLSDIENQIHNLAGIKFNIASPKQLGEILYEKLQITEKPKHTKTKQYSTAEDVLQKLSDRHPIIALVLSYRSLSKLISTYVDALPALMDPKTDRIHTTYNQAATATGRLSSQNPNLQNIPIRTELGKEIRRAFIPFRPQDMLLAADYSQIELRIIAHLSQDPVMMADFLQNIDIHTATAANVYGVNVEDVSPEMRRASKMVNFGIIYGISAFGLADRLRITRKEAASLIEKYFEKYKGIHLYMQESIEKAKQQGYVETMLHRRRYLPDIHSSNAVVRGFAERNAINAPIQGSSADMIKVAMVNIDQSFQTNALQSQMLLQVHDELVCNVVPEEKDIVCEILRKEMQNALPLSIPLEVDIRLAKNWLEAH